ncbi:glycine/betaine ABC transporter substrate-binding protein, partial [Vibrio sp. Vb2880]|nr:glycine/betaine ABC transporter substrate-binding protein [Vibrio sp. Vb2880]
MSKMTKIFSTIALSTLATGAYANQCETVRFADVGWTDITATTA